MPRRIFDLMNSKVLKFNPQIVQIEFETRFDSHLIFLRYL